MFTTPWLKRWSHSSLPSFHVCFPLSVGYILIRQVRTIGTFKERKKESAKKIHLWSVHFYAVNARMRNRRIFAVCWRVVLVVRCMRWKSRAKEYWHKYRCAEREFVGGVLPVSSMHVFCSCYKFHLCVLFSVTLYVHIAAFKAGIMSIHKCRR